MARCDELFDDRARPLLRPFITALLTGRVVWAERVPERSTVSGTSLDVTIREVLTGDSRDSDCVQI